MATKLEFIIGLFHTTASLIVLYQDRAALATMSSIRTYLYDLQTTADSSQLTEIAIYIRECDYYIERYE